MERKKMKRIFIAIALLAGIGMLGCSSSENNQEASSSATQQESEATANVALDGEPVTVAGVTFTPPSTWQSLGASGMRQAEFAYGPVDDDSDSATMAVYYFGPESGGSVTQNINRWIGQMSLPGGGDPSEAAKKSDFTVNGMKAHMVEIAGIYNSSMGGPMSGSAVPLEDYRMAAVVLEGPQGNVFFKLTGPDKTAADMIDEFKAMMHAVKLAG
jgi:ABC-type glycerol-3-phosphate transport system substrate-binding protein